MLEKWNEMPKMTGYPCLKLIGSPDCKRYWAVMPEVSECDYVLVKHYDGDRFIDQPWRSFWIDADYERAVEAAQTAIFE